MPKTFLIWRRKWMSSSRRTEGPKQNEPKNSTLRYIIIKRKKVKDKERLLKTARGKQFVMYKGTPRR